MNAPPPYLWVYALFATVTVVSLTLFGIAGTLKSMGVSNESRRRILRSTGTLLFGWMALGMLLGWLGVFRAGVDRKVPFIALGIGIPVILGIWLIRRSATAREILHAVPQTWIVGIQCYRGLGSMFLVLHGLRLLPGAFALPAGFGDVLVGFTALLVAAIYAQGGSHRSWLVAAWNVFGLADLAIAVTTGFLSAPGPFQMLSFGEPNYLVGAYPLVMVPVYAVPLSILLHIGSLTKLTWEHQAKAAASSAEDLITN